MEVIHTIGRRKTSVARLYVSKGKGAITVNKKNYTEFFPTATLQYKIVQPLALTVMAPFPLETYKRATEVFLLPMV